MPKLDKLDQIEFCWAILRNVWTLIGFVRSHYLGPTDSKSRLKIEQWQGARSARPRTHCRATFKVAILRIFLKIQLSLSQLFTVKVDVVKAGFQIRISVDRFCDF